MHAELAVVVYEDESPILCRFTSPLVLVGKRPAGSVIYADIHSKWAIAKHRDVYRPRREGVYMDRNGGRVKPL